MWMSVCVKEKYSFVFFQRPLCPWESKGNLVATASTSFRLLLAVASLFLL